MRILSLIIKEQKEENEEEVECYQVIRKRGGVKKSAVLEGASGREKEKKYLA